MAWHTAYGTWGIYRKHVPVKPCGKRPDPRLYLACEDAEGLARLDALKAEADAVLRVPSRAVPPPRHSSTEG